MSPKHSLSGVEPTLFNRTGNHTSDLAIAWVSFWSGVLVNVGAFAGDALSNLPVYEMPRWVVHGLGVLVMAGGLLTAVGLLVTRTHYTEEIHVEQLGQVFLGFGWGAYAYATWYYTSHELGSLVLATGFCVNAAARWGWLWYIERHDRMQRSPNGRLG